MKQSFLAFPLALVLAALTATAQALPSIDQVRTAVAQGHYAEAETMVREVVVAKPDSARAHYVLAEILAHERQFDQAAIEVRRASALDPAVSFTQPEKFRAFQALLEREQAGHARASDRSAAVALRAAAPDAVAPRQGLPGWLWVLGLLAIGVLLVKWMSGRRSRAAVSAYAPALSGGPATGGYGPGPSYPQAPMPGAGGSGLLGTGLAVAGGVAAGMFAERLLQDHPTTELGNNAAGLFPGLDPGRVDPGWNDDSAQRELEDRPVDFGSGDSWDSGDAGSSGSDDGW